MYKFIQDITGILFSHQWLIITYNKSLIKNKKFTLVINDFAQRQIISRFMDTYDPKNKTYLSYFAENKSGKLIIKNVEYIFDVFYYSPLLSICKI